MDNIHSSEKYRHLEKQNELLMEAYRTMFHELHRLQVEEEMLMRKLYEVATAEGRLNKGKSDDATNEDSSIPSEAQMNT